MDGQDLTDDGFQIELPHGWLLKARPAVEGDHRYVYCEPSNDALDEQGEDVDQGGLAKAAPGYLRFGNVDLNHMTLLGPKPVSMGGYGLTIEEARKHEIGLPREVVAKGTRFFLDAAGHVQNETNSALAHAPIMLKCELYRGTSERVAKANETWASMTDQDPPARYYPSIGGYPTKKVGSTIKSVMWKNTAFADVPFFLPVNRTVKAVTTMPYAEFAKAVMAGYGTDSADLSGGAALRRESLDAHVLATVPGGDAHYHAAAGRYVDHLGTAHCAHTTAPVTLPKLTEHFAKCEGMDPPHAASTALRFLREVDTHLARRRAA